MGRGWDKKRRLLSTLNIANIALIDDLRVEFERGLNLLTGETGSGKSIIVDALGVLIGGRFALEMIKAGATRAYIEGLFAVGRNPDLEALLESSGIELESADARAIWVSGSLTSSTTVRNSYSSISDVSSLKRASISFSWP